MAYSTDFRERVFDLYSGTSIPVRQIAQQHGIARSTIYTWRSRRQQTDSLQRSPNRGGRRAKLDEQATEQLRELLRQQPGLTLAALCAHLQRISGVCVHRATMSRTLRRMGLRPQSQASAIDPTPGTPSTTGSSKT